MMGEDGVAGSVKERIGDLVTGDGGDGWDYLPPTGDGGGGGGMEPEPERTPPPEGYRIGMWLAIVSMSILFISLNVLYFYNLAGQARLETRRGSIVMPDVLWLSTGLILLSSFALELGRRALRRRQEPRFRLALVATLLLGGAFLVAQLSAWQALQAAGFYVNRNFRSGYAYIFTALHGVHLVGGLWGLIYLLLRSPAGWTALRRRVSVDVTALYWHFLTGLWLYLWFVVFIWK